MADADPWTMLLRAPRARDAFLLRVVMGGPWSLLVADEAPLTVMGQLQGNAWFAVEGGEPTLLHPGDVVLVRAPVHYRVASDPSVQPSMTIGPDQSCTGADGRELADALAQGVRTWGNDPAGADRLIVGTYRSDTQVSRLLLGALPPALVVPAAAPELIGLLNRELAADADAGVLDRLLDLVLIDAVRTARAQLTSGAGGPVGVALRAIHSAPAQPWTVGSLAARAGVSRSALAARFRHEVGDTPSAYLTHWRLALAADLLLDTDATLDSIAARVGYGSPFSLSAAFSRRFGVSPRAFRTRGQAEGRGADLAG